MLIAKTERLFLRHFHVADLEAMADVFGDAEVMRFGRGPQPREWVQEWLRKCQEDYYQKWGFGLWAVVRKPDGRVIGFCGLTRFDDVDGKPEIEIGYRLARAFWGCGLATEAVRAARDYAFEILGLPRLVAIIDPQNTASIHVVQKVGLRYEKDVIFREKMQRLYALHRSESAEDLAAAVGKEAANELASALGKIKHCLAQLSDEQVWRREQSSLNSIGNLILHLCGNLRQWIIAGLGGAADVRHRPSEFTERGPIPKDELLHTLDAVVAEAKEVLARLTSRQLLETRRIQGFDVTALAAIFDTVPHFRGHTQEIIHMTRLQLGDAYKFFWVPTTPEQGARNS